MCCLVNMKENKKKTANFFKKCAVFSIYALANT